MKRALPLSLALVLGVCSCTTPVSQLKLPEQTPTAINSEVLTDETTEESEGGFDDILDYFPPMIAFGSKIMNHDGLAESMRDPEVDFFDKNGFISGAGSVNTYRVDDEGNPQGEHMVFTSVAGQKNLVLVACQGVGSVLIRAEKDGETVAEKSLDCSIPATELSMEFTIAQGGDVWVVQEPSSDTRGIYEVMIYS
ncbi:hypothetical protein QMQ05_01705 [Glutamicibacter ectropisis]|uniref:Sortase n=1 Tax=Glutamicibacter ectropisis TaxID=3046593 RepID=A0AAU6WFM6_9MICC